MASEGAAPETLRLYRPGRLVSFGPRDTAAAAYPRAVTAARAAGFEAVRRLAGGRAAVFHEQTIAFAWTVPAPTPTEGIHSRYEELAGIMCRAIRGLGVDARIGEVAGEYCPGEYSVNAGGRTKLMGVGQRLGPRAAHLGGVVVVGGSGWIRDVLIPVYEALGLAWDPATVGSVEDALGSATYAQVEEAVLREFSDRYALAQGALTPETLALAEALEPDHLAPGSG